MESGRTFGVALIGCGNIGSRRAEAVSDTSGTRLITCVDVSEDRAKVLAGLYDCEYDTDWRRACLRPDVDLVIVSTANYQHAPISITAMQNGKHVLCEKPLGRNPLEAETMVSAARDNGVKLKTGFNHRYFNNVLKAHELVSEGRIGNILTIRGWTGHGGWETLGQTWYVDPELSGGGTLLDNGQHLLDLARWFMGAKFIEAKGCRTTNMWPIEPVEDNAFGLFKTEDNRIAMLHSSWTQWKGYLYLEVHGTEGYVTIDYDTSQTRLGTQIGRWTPAQEQTYDFSTMKDRSWALELQEFINAIIEDRQPEGSGYDGWRTVVMAYAVYESSESGNAVQLP